MADGFQGANLYNSVVLVDRALLGGCELIHDGVRIVFKPGEVEKAVPQFFAEWLFQTDKERVHTRDGQFTPRFGIKDASPELLQALGPECALCDPIEIDTKRIERWDVESYAPSGQERKVLTISQRPGEFANVGSEGTFGQER